MLKRSAKGLFRNNDFLCGSSFDTFLNSKSAAAKIVGSILKKLSKKSLFFYLVSSVI